VRRAFWKSVSWRVLATCITVTVAYGVTGRWDFASTVGLIDAALKFVFYILHERVWEHDRMADRSTGIRQDDDRTDADGRVCGRR